MVKKQLRFFLQVKARWRDRRFITIFLLVLCFSLGLRSPLLADSSTKSSVVQNRPAAQLEQEGRVLYDKERYSEAAAIFQQAAAAFQAQKNKINQAMSLSNASLSYQQVGYWERAERAIAESLNLLGYSQRRGTEREIPPTKFQIQDVLAQSLDVQARLQLKTGQAESALTTWQQAAKIYTQIDKKLESLRSRINSAQALQTLGHYGQAKKLLERASDDLQGLPNSNLKATGLRSLGNTLRIAGNLAESSKILQESLAVAKQLQSSQEIAETLLSLGNTALVQQNSLKAALAQQDTQKATEYSQQAIEYYQQAAATSTSPTTRIQAQLNQLRLLADTKQLEAARKLAQQIQPQLAELPSSRSAVYAQINFAQSLMKLESGTAERNNPVAIADPKPIARILAKSIRQATDIQDWRAKAYALGQLGELYERTHQWSEAQKLIQEALMLTLNLNATDISYRLQWQLARLLKSQGDAKGAIAAYTEAVKQLQSLRQDLVALNPDAQFSFRDEVEPVYRDLVDFLLQSSADSQLNQEKLIQARATIESLQLAELDNFLRLACLEGRQIQIDQVVNKEDRTAAVLYPIISKDKLAVILKLPDQPLRYYQTIIDRESVEKVLNNWQQQLKDPYVQLETQSSSPFKQVYDWLIQPFEADLSISKIRTLVFVLDSYLRNLPMAALYDGEQYLIEKYAIALTPGLQLLNSKGLKSQEIRVLGAGLTEARHGYDALPFVKSELEQIKAEVTSQILWNDQFTSSKLEEKISSVPFPIVHLGTHAEFSSQIEKTFIVAWDKKLNVNELNDIFRARDLIRDSPIELLVLSACQTAEGDRRAALGIAGVAMRAGARSTIASLWNVDDEFTAEMMPKFYRKLTDRQINKAEALRQAQLSFLKHPKYKLPMFWASYVLVGNWL